MNMVTVATFNEPAPAGPLQQRLEKAGIHAEIHDESKYGWSWFVATPMAAFRLKVHKKDYEIALPLLNEWDAADGALRDAVRCPQCRHSRVEYPQFTRKFFLPNLVGLASVLGIFEKEFYCQDCGYMWPKEVKLHPPRKHSAPAYFIEKAAPVPSSSTLLMPKEQMAEAPKSQW